MILGVMDMWELLPDLVLSCVPRVEDGWQLYSKMTPPYLFRVEYFCLKHIKCHQTIKQLHEKIDGILDRLNFVQAIMVPTG